jgi:hypothetical protein
MGPLRVPDCCHQDGLRTGFASTDADVQMLRPTYASDLALQVVPVPCILQVYVLCSQKDSSE